MSNFALFFICGVLVVDTFTALEKHNGFKPILLGFPILIGLILSSLYLLFAGMLMQILPQNN